jgi:hypothetical protein
LGCAGDRFAQSKRIPTVSPSTTDTIRSQSVLLVQCDIPQELTIAEYRDARPKAEPRRKRRRPRLHRRRSG